MQKANPSQKRGWRRALAGSVCGLLLALPNAVPPAGASRKSEALSTEAVLRDLDREAKGLHTLTADIERTTVTAVVNDRSTETGRIFLRTDGKMRIELTKPDERTILRNGDKVWHYLPKSKRVEEYDIGKYGALADALLTIGLGSSGSSLKKHYLVTTVGEATVDDRKTVELELVPKDEKLRNQIDRIQLWVDTSSWLAIQQKFYETGSGDYIIINYRNIVANAKLPDNDFKPRWPKDVTVVKPQANSGL
ncbi:MAG TPA: outer membrane lipoprotein carrier protein LolA [Candidatus Acidoferrales bacterium]|nr:outer membrane lipoprotein carrier protein LolA [Candidatus Acidoferrales bacterium]